MFFHKVFHVHQSPTEARAQLARISRYCHRVPGLKKAVVTEDGVAQFECFVDHQIDLHAVLVQLPCDEEENVLFHSTVGNVRIAGLLVFTEVRPGLTEVHLTVDYTIASWLGRAQDFFSRKLERFVDEALRKLQVCLNGDMQAAYDRAEQNFRLTLLEAA